MSNTKTEDNGMENLTQNLTENHPDRLYHMDLLNGQARALFLRSTAMVEEARRIHSLGRVATAALGRLITMTSIMGMTLKETNASVSCVIHGDGPLGTLIAVGRPNGDVKGYVQTPDVDLPRVNGKLPVGDAVGHKGTLTVVKDLGFGEPFSGVVNLVSGELGEDFAMYFTASEQTPSLVSLGVLTKDTVEAAGGLLVQMLPGASDEAAEILEKQSVAFGSISQIIAEMDDMDVIGCMMGKIPYTILATNDVRYACDCSRERVERALISLGKEELERLIEEQDECVVGCQFCNIERKFTKEEMRQLLERATRP